jgi:retron-type reverse transcriptase
MRPLVNPKASTQFKKLLSIKNINRVYEEEVSWKNIRGIDRLSVYQFEKNKDAHFKVIRDKCLNSSYNFSPYLEKLRTKGRNRAPRVISLASIRDRIVLAIIKNYLHDIFPESVNRTLPNTYVNKIKKFYQTTDFTDIFIYKVDIHQFYDSIQHQTLLKTLSSKIQNKPELNLIKKAIENPTVSSDFRKTSLKELKNDNGVPQGLAISNILANIYLQKLDEAVKAKSLLYIRYVDDIFIAVRASHEKRLKSQTRYWLSKLGLETNKDKTKWVPIEAEIDYLGYHFNLPTVSVKQGTIDKYIKRLSALFSVYANIGPEAVYKNVKIDVGKQLFISDVNEKITGAISENKRYGWIFYFLEMTDLTLLYNIDRLVRDKFCARIKKRKWKPDFSKIKSIAKSYYDAKYDPLGGYIENYDDYNSIAKKTKFLAHWGVINSDENVTHTANQIERMFKQFIRKRLADLEADLTEAS